MTTFNKPLTLSDVRKLLIELDVPLNFTVNETGIQFKDTTGQSVLAEHLSYQEAFLFIRAYSFGYNRNLWEDRFGKEVNKMRS